MLRKHERQHQFHAHKNFKSIGRITYKNFFQVDSNDVLAMLLHMTNSCKWVTIAPTLPCGKDRENESHDSLKNWRIRSIYEYDNLQRWLCYSGSPLDCKETMPLAYHLCKSFCMRNLNSLSNNTKLRLRMNACSMLWANA